MVCREQAAPKKHYWQPERTELSVSPYLFRGSGALIVARTTEKVSSGGSCRRSPTPCREKTESGPTHFRTPPEQILDL